MISGYQGKLIDIYTQIQEEEARLLKKRKEEIQNVYPEILDLDNEIQKLSLKLSLSILQSKNAESTLNEFRERIMELRFQKCELLVSKGYDQEYLNLHYRCNSCKDTGFIGINKCSCYKDKLIKLYYKNSDLDDTLREKNFKYFDINLFSSHKLGDDKYSPRKNMENTLEYMLDDYIPRFKDHDTNLLFFGNPGSGKTYLSYCIAKELLDYGFLVVYKTSDELINNLKDIRFNSNTKLEKLLLDCDLLIIDDLGAEQKSDFVITELFNLLNRKLLKKKKMLVSTNLSLQDITKIYSERICSRLIGDFKLCKFYSEDIRIKLNLQKNR